MSTELPPVDLGTAPVAAPPAPEPHVEKRDEAEQSPRATPKSPTRGAWSFYSEQDGRFLSRHFTSTDARALRLNTPAGYRAIQGHFDHLSQRVDPASGEVIDDPEMARAHAQVHERERRQQSARQQIEQLERQQLRPLRELQLDAGAREAYVRLREIEAQISKLRQELTT